MRKEIGFKLSVAYIVLTTLFGLVPDTFVNYGYDYYQFLNIAWLSIPLLLLSFLWFLKNMIRIGRHVFRRSRFGLQWQYNR